jgi:hypothetical protein
VELRVFLSSAQNEDEWSPYAPAALAPGNNFLYPLDWELNGSQIWVWTWWHRNKSLPLPGIEPRSVTLLLEIFWPPLAVVRIVKSKGLLWREAEF